MSTQELQRQYTEYKISKVV